MARLWALLGFGSSNALEWVDEHSRDTVGSSAERVFRPCRCGARRLVHAPCCHCLSL